jgi:hypothetical protein
MMKMSSVAVRVVLWVLSLWPWLIVVPLVAVVAPTGVGSDAAESWKSAVIEGLRVGDATRAEVLEKFGDPSRIEIYPETQTGGSPIEWLIYDKPIDRRFHGHATVWIDGQTGTVTRVTITPEGLSRARLIEELGPEFQMTRYRFCEELGDWESAPIIEDPSGSLEFMEYRQLGISVQFNWRGDVQQLRFLSSGIGITTESCPSPQGDFE